MGVSRGVNRHVLRLVFDTLVGLAVVALFSVNFTGLVLHEWVGLAFAAAAIVHIALSWDWVAATTRRLFGALGTQPRVTWIVNAALFVSMTLVIASGVMISEVAVPQGRGSGFLFWRLLHTQASNATVALVGLHLGLNWRWVVDTFRLYVLRRPPAGRRPAAAATGGGEAG